MSAERRPPRTARIDPRAAELSAYARDAGYHLTELIGTGGMGIVYRAIDADGTEVAMKMLRHEIADDPRARSRLAREVAAQRRLVHDGVVQVLDAELDSSHAFVVTEFVPGPTLDDAVGQHGPLHPEAVREIGLVLGETLEAVHGAGVIHRDLKPSNIMLRGAVDADFDGFDPEGDGLDPVIIDFGIALAADESRMTSTGLVMGTAAYMDPEVIRTDHATEAGDWWSLAAVMHFAATGRAPFGTGRADTIFFRADRGELDLAGLPVELAAWLRDGLRARPEERPDPAEHLERLAHLDLTREGSLEETEVQEDSPAAAEEERGAGLAGAAGAAGALGAAGAASAARGAASTGGEPRTEALPVDRTEALPVDRTEALQVDRTEALPVDRTEALPVDRTEALPQQDPVTEKLERIEQPTTVMPVIRAEPSAAPRPMPQRVRPQGPPAQQRHATPQAYAQQQDYPHQPSYPQQGYPQQPHPAQPPQDHAQPHFQQGHAPQGYAPAQQGYASMPGMVFPAWQPAPRRTLLVWLGHLWIIGLAAVAPFIALALTLILGTVSRMWERLHRTVESRRARGSGGGVGLAVASAPFRALQGLLEVVLQLILPLLLGALVALGIDAVVSLQGTPMPEAALFAITMATGLLLIWIGPGSRTTREGAHRMLAAATPDRVWGAVILGLLLLVLVGTAAAILSRGGSPDYIPFFQLPRLGPLLPWRP